MPEAMLPALSAAGGIMLAILLQIVVSAWQESKDLESTLFFVSVGLWAFLRLSPLVLMPLQALEANAPADLGPKMVEGWIYTIRSAFALILLTPVLRFVKESRGLHDLLGSLSEKLAPRMVSRSGKSVDEATVALRKDADRFAGILLVVFFWLAVSLLNLLSTRLMGR